MAPRFPDAAFRASREPRRDLPLVVRRGSIPRGLTGHLFILSPVGSVDSGGAPYPDGNDRPTVINGDGMVWRIDLPGDSGAPVLAQAELLRPPDLHWDEVTKAGSPLAFAGFVDLGMLRASPFLGTRNFANTAFVPVAASGRPTRLLCTYDAGPPVEIDPLTLETLGVVGAGWDAEALDDLVPFPPILATAHPFWDAHTGELFAVNYGRSTGSMLGTLPLVQALAALPDVVDDWLDRIVAALGRTPAMSRALAAASRGLTRVLGLIDALGATPPRVSREVGPERVLPASFFDLVWWSGEGDIVRLPIVDMATGKQAAVLESMHQVAATRHWVLLLDTNFKLRLDQFYGNPLPYVPAMERLLRTALASRQGDSSNLWIVSREAIARARGGGSRAVPAFKVALPGAVHFLADYDDTDGIVIQCAHGMALDIAEWVRRDDVLLDGRTARPPMHGMIASPVDVSRLGRFVIDPRARRVVEGRILNDDRMWGIGLYAARGVPAWEKPPARLERVFWFASGLWPDNYTLFIRSLYAEYPDRMVALAGVDELVRSGGRPTTLFAVDSDTFAIADAFEFAPGLTMSSPQFIEDRSGETSGWVSAVVWDETSTALWIFAAGDLASGPLVELEVPAEFGFSLHTAWLPEVTSTRHLVPPAPPEDVDILVQRLARLRADARAKLAKLVTALESQGN